MSHEIVELLDTRDKALEIMQVLSNHAYLAEHKAQHLKDIERLIDIIRHFSYDTQTKNHLIKSITDKLDYAVNQCDINIGRTKAIADDYAKSIECDVARDVYIYKVGGYSGEAILYSNVFYDEATFKKMCEEYPVTQWDEDGNQTFYDHNAIASYLSKNYGFKMLTTVGKFWTERAVELKVPVIKIKE